MERSCCTSCKTSLTPRDLIPVFSLLVSKAKCRHCGVSVSMHYIGVEISCALICLAIYSVYGFSIESLFILAATPFIMALFVIDLRLFILPNQLVFILFILGLLRVLYLGTVGLFKSPSELFIPYIGGALCYASISWVLGAIMTKVLGKDALGFGDVKFFLVAGLWLGLSFLPYFMILSGFFAIFMGLFWCKFFKTDIFPFGPALIVSFLALLLFQGSLFEV